MQEKIAEKADNFACANDRESYIRNWTMPNDRVWATDVEIISTAAYLETDIYTFTKQKALNKKKLKKIPEIPWRWTRHCKELFKVFNEEVSGPNEVKAVDPKIKSNRAIYLFHENLNHYMPMCYRFISYSSLNTSSGSGFHFRAHLHITLHFFWPFLTPPSPFPCNVTDRNHCRNPSPSVALHIQILINVLKTSPACVN